VRGMRPRAAAARTLIALVALIVGASTRTLPAQPLLTPTIPATFRSPLDTVIAPGPRGPRHVNRLIPAMIGGLSGAVALGFAGYMIVGGCTTKCDVLEWDEVIIGGFVGAIAGSTIGGARPRGRGLCTAEQRYGMALGGAFLGTLAAVGLAQIPHTRPGLILTVPLGSVMFMGGC
jgi:hypothetical protein